MSQPYFDLYYRGEVLDGYSADQVRRDLATLFKTDDSRIASYFSGQTEVIKLRVAQVTVPRYQRAMREIGAELIVVPEGSPAPANPQPTAMAAPKPVDTSSLSLAQTGADVLDERPAQPVTAVTTSSLSLSDTGTDLRDSGASSNDATPRPPDTSHLSLE